MRIRRRTTFCMLLTFAVVITGLFLQISRTAEISGRSKRIAALQAEIDKANKSAQYLEIQLSSLQSPQRIAGEAANLHLYAPEDGQVFVLSVPDLNTADTAAQVADNADGGDA